MKQDDPYTLHFPCMILHHETDISSFPPASYCGLDHPPPRSNRPSNARFDDNRRSEENRGAERVGSPRQITGGTPENADGNGSTVSRRHLVSMLVGAGISVTLSLPSAAALWASADTDGERRKYSRSASGSGQQINTIVFNTADGTSSLALPPVSASTKRIFLARHGQVWV